MGTTRQETQPHGGPACNGSASTACDGALRRAFGFLGKRWNGIILATLANGPQGFAELRRSVEGISDSVLSDRLAELSRAGLLERTVFVGPPTAVTYSLTEAGQELTPVLDLLKTWSDKHMPADEAGPT